MDFENIENMDKNEYVALGTTVKQEMVDNGIADDTVAETTAETSAGSNEINSATTGNNTQDAAEINNPVCDSAEKQVWTKFENKWFIINPFVVAFMPVYSMS